MHRIFAFAGYCRLCLNFQKILFEGVDARTAYKLLEVERETKGKIFRGGSDTYLASLAFEQNK